MTLIEDAARANPSSPGPDFAAIKAKQNAAWASGDYAQIGVTLQLTGELLAEAMDLPPGAAALDVAAGNGNATLALARRGARVTSTDYVGSLLAKGKGRADAEGLSVDFQIADAEALPFETNAFDGVASSFGVMFAPNQTQAAQEMMRVCRPGGVIGLASWTPDGFIGALFKTLGAYVAPPAGLAPPSRWGDPAWLRAAFAGAARISLVEREFVFRYPSHAAFVDAFRAVYGPVQKAFLALPEAERPALAHAIAETTARFDISRDGSARIVSRYLEAVIAKAG